jgi:tetratricopeptide (TPR) repeat protein
MSEIFSAFGKIAQYLRHPLVLIGFVVATYFYVTEKRLSDLLESKILTPFTAKQGSSLLEHISNHDFELGKLTISLSFVAYLVQLYFKKKVEIKQAAERVDFYIKQHQLDSEQLKLQQQALNYLCQERGVLDADTTIDAMNAWAEGDTTKAENLFEDVIKKGEQEAKHTAQAYRNLGALAYLHDTQKALNAYRRATELDPDNVEGWNQLGNLLRRIGELDKAIEVYEEVLTLSEAHHNQEGIAVAFGNLGVVYQTRGELDKAIEVYEKVLTLHHQEGIAVTFGNLGVVYKTRGELDKAVEFYEKSLAIYKELGKKGGIANQYGNLGVVYQLRGDLDNAIEFYEKSLAIYKELDRKEGMANQYGNLGIVYQMRGDLDNAVEFYEKSLAIYKELGKKGGIADQYGNLGNVYKTQGNKIEARRYYQMSIELFKQLGSPNAQKVQASLDAL